MSGGPHPPYGGEGFTVLTEELDLISCTRLVERLQAVTPDGQTFSAGVAHWDVTTDPSCVVTQADEALYEAKRAGAQPGRRRPWSEAWTGGPAGAEVGPRPRASVGALAGAIAGAQSRT